MAESTAALTFGDLVLAVAEKLGIAFYGAAGDEAAQVPTNVYDLDKCKRYVQDGIRMFIADAPLSGWRWQRPIASVVLWQDRDEETLATDAWVTATSYAVGSLVTETGVSYVCLTAHVSGTFSTDLTANYWRKVRTVDGGVFDGDTNVTPVTASYATFYSSMEGATISIDGVDDFVIASYVSSTVVNVTGNASAASTDVFSMESGGVFGLPQTFGGEVAGDITYAAGSNLGVSISWNSELEIRRSRENWDATVQHPYYAAWRRNQDNSRRWDLVVYPTPSGDYTVEFPYIIYFDKITELTDVHPAGVAHDEAMKWAALGQAELQGEDAAAGYMSYYSGKALPNSIRVDERAAPRRLGYCGNPDAIRVDIRNFRDFTRRPTVGFS